jgi:hypothetical protein
MASDRGTSKGGNVEIRDRSRMANDYCWDAITKTNVTGVVNKMFKLGLFRSVQRLRNQKKRYWKYVQR